MKYLLDSNIIIYYLNGNEAIYSFIEKYKDVSVISIITYYEVLNYNFSKEEDQIVRIFLEELEIINISKEIINQAISNRKIKKIKLADNFILATVQFLDVILVTRNTKDFIPYTQNIINPFE